MLDSLEKDGVHDVILRGHPQRAFDLEGAYRHVVVGAGGSDRSSFECYCRPNQSVSFRFGYSALRTPLITNNSSNDTPRPKTNQDLHPSLTSLTIFLPYKTGTIHALVF